MRAPANVRLERLETLLNQLLHESEKGKPIIVEGTKDRDALRTIGIAGRIDCLQNSRLNPIGFVEKLGDIRQAVVLTDFDNQGVSLAYRLTRILISHGTSANTTIWHSLRELTRSDLRSIEELPRYRERLRLETENPKHATFTRKHSRRDNQIRKIRP